MDLDAGAIFDRARKEIDARSDAELSRALGKSANAVATWRQRNTIPLAELVAFARKNGISLEWLLTGESESRPVGMPRIDRLLLMSIAGKLQEALRGFGAYFEDGRKLVGISTAIYNRLVEGSKNDAEIQAKVDSEISYARDVLYDIFVQDLEAVAAGPKALEEHAASLAKNDPIERFLVAAHHGSRSSSDAAAETGSSTSAGRERAGAKVAKKRGT